MDATAKIKRVYLDDLSHGEKSDVSLWIYLSNGQQIVLNLNEKRDDMLFAGVAAGRYNSDPLTDGSRFYWPDGPSFTLGNVVETLLSDSGGVITEATAYEGRPDEIDVTLAGGHMISVLLTPAYMYGGQPQAGGGRVFWPNGLSVTLDEIIAPFRGDGTVRTEDPGNEGPGNSGRKSRNKWIAASLAACAVLIVAVAVVLPEASLSHDADVIEFEDGLVPLAAPDFEQDVVFPDAEDITIPADTTNIKMPLYNPAGNSCYLTFRVTLTDSGEILYISELAAPGMETEGVTFVRPLEQGEYRAILDIRAYSADGMFRIDKVSKEFIITVT